MNLDSRDNLTNIKQDQFMMENGKEDLEMDTELRNGQTVQHMKDNGKTIKHMEKENSLM